MVKIFLDPGHGGKDSGATGNSLLEKNLTLQIALQVKKYLELYENVTIKMSRTTDKTVSLKARTDAANRWQADYYMSIHVNAGGGTGFESYIYNKLSNTSETAKKRAIIHDKIMQKNNMRDRGKKKANFHVLRESNMSAVLTENGFIDTKADAEKLKDATWIKRIAQAHAEGIVYLFRLKKKKQPSPSPTVENYTVKKSDTLSSIAKAFETTINEIVSLNKWLVTGKTIKVPQKISGQIKVGDKVKVKKSAKQYATGETIPAWVKERQFTVQQVASDRLLLQEITSWVNEKDVNKQ